MKQCDGEPSDVAYVLASVLHRDGETKAEILAKAERHVLSLKVGEGGTVEIVRLEGPTWNIPFLEPEAWKRQEDYLVALNKRCGR